MYIHGGGPNRSIPLLFQDYNDDIRQEQMWEMQVLSSQRNNNKGDEGGAGSGSGGAEYPNEDERLGDGDAADRDPESPQEEHPALRGVQPGEWKIII